MTRRLSLLLAALCWSTLAQAQIVLPGGGSGGGGGSVTFNTTCPASTASGSTITLTNNLPVQLETGAFTVACGIGYQATVTAPTVVTIPVTAGLYTTVKNLSASAFGAALTLTPASGTIDGQSTINLWPGQMAIIWSDGTNVQTDHSPLPINLGYTSGNFYPTGIGFGVPINGQAWATAGMISCAPYYVSPPGMTIKAIGFGVNIADATPNYVSVALYTNGADQLPGALIDSIGTTAVSIATTGGKFENVANTTDLLPPGWIWTCTASNSTTGGMYGVNLSMTSAIGSPVVNSSLSASNSGAVGISCTGKGTSSCPAPVWAAGSGSSYTWPSSLNGATWTSKINGVVVPAISLQAN